MSGTGQPDWERSVSAAIKVEAERVSENKSPAERAQILKDLAQASALIRRA